MMELKRYFNPLLRWWWLLLTAGLVAAVFSFLATLQQPPVYQARTTLMIGRAIENPNPSSNEFWLSQQLAATYADIAHRELVRNATMEALGLSWLPEYRARALPNSQLIEISVTDTSPERAMAVANGLAEQLIERSPTGAEGNQSEQEFIRDQLEDIKVQIEETKDEITRQQSELGSMDSARQITDTQNQIAALQNKLSTLQTNYADLFSLTQSGAINTLSVIEPAGLPTSPIGPGRLISILSAAAIGLALAAAAAYLIEYLDDTIRTPDQVKQVTGAPILGYIADMGAEDSKGPYVLKNPRAPVAEAYRTLRTNLEFAGVDQPLRKVLISSAETKMGKTSLACNLAAIMGQGEKRVALLDADLRRPRVHELMGITNEVGLSDVFLNRLRVDDVMREIEGLNVGVIPAGKMPPNPTELLGSNKMKEILERLEYLSDIVIIDGPPFLVADAAVLASKADGVLLVIRPGYAHDGAVRAMMEQIGRAGARVIGVALNRISAKDAFYYSGSPYLSPYYETNPYYVGKESKREDGRARRIFPSHGRNKTVNGDKQSRDVRVAGQPRK